MIRALVRPRAVGTNSRHRRNLCRRIRLRHSIPRSRTVHVTKIGIGRDVTLANAAAGAGDVLTAVDAAGGAAAGAMGVNCRSRNMRHPELTKIAVATRVMRLRDTFP